MARKEQSLFSFEADTEDEMANSGLNAYGNRQDGEYLDNGYSKITSREMMMGDTYEGIPEMTVFFNEGKLSKKGKPLNFDSLRIRLWDTNNKELLDVYGNIPKVGDGVIKAPIRKGDKFFRGGFDLIYSFYNVVGAPGIEGKNKFTNVDLLQIIDYINDNITNLEIKAVAGHPANNDNSFEIVKME